MRFVLGPAQPAAFANYLAAGRALAEGRTSLESRPPFVRVEVTTRCNLACEHCWNAHYKLAERDLDPAVLERLDREVLAEAAAVQFTDLGEPLLYRHFDRVLAALDHHRWAYSKLFTNGLVMTRALAERLVESGLRELAVSVDGASAATFEAIRPPGKFDRLLANLKLIVESRRAGGRTEPVLTFNVVTMRENLGELAELVRLAAAHDAAEIYFFDLFPLTAEIARRTPACFPERTRAALTEAFAVGRELGVEVFTGIDWGSPPVAGEPIDERFYRGDLEVLSGPPATYRDSRVRFRVRVRNGSPFTWHSSRTPSAASRVNLAYHLYEPDGALLEIDGQRTALAADLAPGAELEQAVEVRLPDRPGGCLIEFDILNEDDRWFGVNRRLPVEVAEEVLVEATPDSGRCEYPWKYISVKVDGRVHPCRFLSIPMGDLAECGFDEIWNSPLYQRLRRTVREGTFELCLGAACPFLAARSGDLAAAFELLRAPSDWAPGETRRVRLRVRNTGRAAWNAAPDEACPSHYCVSYHLMDESGHVLLFDGRRAALPHDLAPGAAAVIDLPVQAPAEPGVYVASVDLVRELTAWLSACGSPTLAVPMRVGPGRRSLLARLRRRRV